MQRVEAAVYNSCLRRGPEGSAEKKGILSCESEREWKTGGVLRKDGDAEKVVV